MKPIDLSKIISKYKTGWIALKPDYSRVVGFGKTPKQAIEAARIKGIGSPVLMRASKSYAPIAPSEISLP